MENKDKTIHEYTENKKKEKLLEQRLKKVEQALLDNERKISIIERSLRGKK